VGALESKDLRRLLKEQLVAAANSATNTEAKVEAALSASATIFRRLYEESTRLKRGEEYVSKASRLHGDVAAGIKRREAREALALRESEALALQAQRNHVADMLKTMKSELKKTALTARDCNKTEPSRQPPRADAVMKRDKENRNGRSTRQESGR